MYPYDGCYVTYYVQAKEAALLVQNKNLYEDKEQLSQVREILFPMVNNVLELFLFLGSRDIL